MEVHVEGPVDPVLGWFIDYAEISAAVKPLLEEHLDHFCLNDTPGMENPTSENIALWLWGRLAGVLPGLFEIVVYETCTARCSYRGPAQKAHIGHD
jgi:6-pyruvoyltetrahydropterin/6-carboxytetrahydropterin synthase